MLLLLETKNYVEALIGKGNGYDDAPRLSNGGLLVFYRNLEKLLKTDRQNGANYVSVPKDVFRRLLAGAIRSKNLFDERFYVEFYPDIAAAVRSKKVKSGLDHYLGTGYFEN